MNLLSIDAIVWLLKSRPTPSRLQLALHSNENWKSVYWYLIFILAGYLKGKIGNTPVHKDDTLGYADTECSKSFDLPTPPARKISIPLIPKKTACGANEAYDGDILSDLINLPSSGTDCHRRRKSDNIHIRTRTHTAASSPTTEDQIQSIAPQCNAQICGPDQVQMFPISIAGEIIFMYPSHAMV